MIGLLTTKACDRRADRVSRNSPCAIYNPERPIRHTPTAAGEPLAARDHNTVLWELVEGCAFHSEQLTAESG
jgi:hypothetical protein